MPSGFMTLDHVPETGGMTAEEQLTVLRDYLFTLLENLRYLLHNLSAENFSPAAMEEMSRRILADVVISNTVITNEIYSDYGAVADLAVDELRSDFERAQRYLDGNTDPLDFLHIHDGEISFLTDTVVFDEVTGEPLTEQLHHDDRYFWWTNSRAEHMTSLEATPYPVTVYRVERLVKCTMRFQDVTEDGVTQKLPRIILGAGYGEAEHPDRGKGFIHKGVNGLNLWYEGHNGVLRGLYLQEGGAIARGPWEFEEDITLPPDSDYPTRAQVQAMIDAATGGNT